MCEPAHSIVQFEPPSDDSQPPPPDGGTTVPVTSSGWKGWLKKIGRLFHISRMGHGHSEALKVHRDLLSKDLGLSDSNAVYLTAPQFLVKPIAYYEGNWWDRKFVVDGVLNHTLFRQESQRCAEQYANLVSLGSLHALRQFLGTSIMTSPHTSAYVEAFRAMLTPRGRSQYEHLLKLADLDKHMDTIFNIDKIDSVELRDRLRRVCLGLTRKRKLLVPEWADDATLWQPAGIIPAS